MGRYALDPILVLVKRFFPTFWQVPSSLHACSALGLVVERIQEQFRLAAGENRCLAVLYNRNDMVGAFHRSEWVAASGVFELNSLSIQSDTSHLVLAEDWILCVWVLLWVGSFVFGVLLQSPAQPRPDS